MSRFNPRSMAWILSQLSSVHRYRKVTYLRQKDFENGSYIITKPGVYKLKENITFNPNPRWDEDGNENKTYDGKSHLDWMPDISDPKQKKLYSSRAFGLGFFAAIVIQTSNVTIDLNGKTLEQSKEHALQQRFYANIELASTPFVEGTGPFDFGKLKPGVNVSVINGTIGRSSHHGIHGNNMRGVLIRKVKFIDFEVAAISLNAPQSCVIKDVAIVRNRQDLPILGTYSAGRFIRSFMRATLDNLDGSVKAEGEAKLEALEQSLDNAYVEIMETGKTTDPLYRNEPMNTDGNVYGILIHGKFSVNDFDDSKSITGARRIVLENVTVDKLKATINEIVGLTPEKKPDAKGYGGAQNDVAGSVLQITEITDNNGRYIPTVLSEVQLFIAEYGTKETKGRTNISPLVVDWSKNGTDINDVINNPDNYIKYVCNGDSMHHLNKGVFGFKFDGVRDLYVIGCKIKDVENAGRMGSLLDGKYEKSHEAADFSVGYTGTDTRGMSFAHCDNANIYKSSVDKIISYNGSSYGIHILNSANKNKITDCYITNIMAGNKVNNMWVGTDFHGNAAPYTPDLPNKIPSVSYLKVERSSKAVACCRVKFDDREDSIKVTKLDAEPNVIQYLG